MQNNVKSIDDYRNAVKLLKLKVIKLQKQNEELNEKLREQGIPVIEETRTAGSLTNQMVMHTFARSCKRLGLTPEMLFRACDLENKQAIKVEDFRLFLGRVRLGLSQPQITTIVRILDEDCSGSIKQSEYYDCLSAYAINEEKRGSGSRSYGQESIIKYGKLLFQAKITAEDSWARMDKESKGFVAPVIFSQFVHALDTQQKINEKEIVAIFNHIDLDKQGTIQKYFYEQEVRKALKAGVQDMGIQNGGQFTQSGSQLQFNLKPSSNLNDNKILNDNNIVQELMVGGMDQSRLVEDKVELNLDMGKVVELRKKLASQGVQLIQFFQQLMDKIKNPESGILLYDFYEAFDEINKKVSRSDQLKLFQLIDNSGNGSIGYDELMLFFLTIKKDSDSYELLYQILTRKLQALDIDIVQYLSIEQVYEGDELDNEKFFHISQQLFKIPDLDSSDKLFKYLDQGGNGILSANEIIESVRKFTDQYQSDPQKLAQSLMNTQFIQMTHSLVDQNLDEYYSTIQKMKPVIQEEDKFDKLQLINGKIIKTKWNTIFTSYEACIKYCYDLVAELQQQPMDSKNQKWCDPEFGPTPEDEFGSKSMYFADNDIPEGSPDPIDVEWLRPEENLARLIENGDDTLIGKTANIFNQDGAIANDVCQSKFLGNCWFISALTIICRYDKYLFGQLAVDQVDNLTDSELMGIQMGVYPPCFQFLYKYGILVMKFNKNGSWIYVVIDDRLCVFNNEFVYGHTREATELWVNYIEKAYAKLHYCYMALTSGDIAQGLSDMTGFIADKLKIVFKVDDKEIEIKDKASNDMLWDRLIQEKQNKSLMGCSAEGGTENKILVKGEESGIMSGHAYGIIDVFELKDEECTNYHKSRRLIRLKNPWGYGEWQLKWSENPDYSQKLDQFYESIQAYYENESNKAKNANEESIQPYKRYTITENGEEQNDDGEFIMCFRDWRRTFSNLFICIDFPEEWSGVIAYDKFGPQTSGAPQNNDASKLIYAQKNPQYIIDLNRKDGKQTEIYVQMIQTDGRLYYGELYPYSNVMKYILLCLFKLDQGEKQLAKFDPKKMIASSGKLQLKREIDTEDTKLSNGRYALIPCTQNAGEQIEFSLGVYFDCKKEEIKVSKIGYPDLKFEKVLAFEEETTQTSNELKKLLQKQTEHILIQKEKL